MSAYLCLDDAIHGNPRAMREVEDLRLIVRGVQSGMLYRLTRGEWEPGFLAWYGPRLPDITDPLAPLTDEARAALSAKEGKP